MERIFRTLYRSHLDAKAPTGIPVGVFRKCFFYPLTNKIKAFTQIKNTNKIDDYGVTYGFYSNGNNVCNRNELGRLLIYQHDAL